ncbi:MAG: hypothetical protein IKD81_04795 [Eubacteriaceae bacterium]|nr:hypothetical protein [Eubacteriaceae bacterium]
MKRTLKLRFLSLFVAVLTAAAVIASPFAAVFAEDGSEEYINCTDTAGNYTYVSNESSVLLNTDEYRYNDKWFSGSSYEFSPQLATLSSIAAITSASYYTSLDEKDNSENSKNLEAFLKDIGFEDVSANTEYNSEKLPYGAGVCIGHKKLTVGDREYTLLAVIPRSAGYKQEWAGNFDVDNANDTHYGFKAGRDEILRFMRKYIKDHGIEGDLKIWMAGHSRGAALTNITAAFLATGSKYFSQDTEIKVNITPENIYAYTFATPRTVVEEGGRIVKGKFLSVRGNYGDRYVGYDTEMPYYGYVGSDENDIIDPHAAIYNGIHNCFPDIDIITLLPLKQWDYGYFGQEFALTDGSAETKAKMLSFLEKVSPYAYGRYTAEGVTVNCDSDDFTWLTFDVDSLSVVEDTSYEKDPDQAAFYAEKIAGLFNNAHKPSDYANTEKETALMALAGIYGMDIDDFVAGFTGDMTTLIEAGVLAYLDYAAAQIASERSVSYNRAVSIALEEILAFANGGSLPEGVGRTEAGDITLDGVVYVLLRYIADRGVESEVDGKTVVTFPEDEKAAQQLYDLILSLAGDYGSLMWSMIKSSAYGFTGTKENPDISGAASVRNMLLYPALISALGDLVKVIIGSEAPYGTNAATDLLVLIKDEDESLAEAADRFLGSCIEDGVKAGLASGRYDAGTDFYNDYAAYGQTLIEKVAVLRKLILDGLFYVEGETFSVADDVRSAVTFVMQTGRLALAHYNELYVAWMKAQDPAYASEPGHAMTHYDAHTYCEAEGNIECWYCEKCGGYFLDKDGTTETTAEGIKAAPTGHSWGDWEAVEASSTGHPGTEHRVCEKDPTHTETRSFSYDAVSGDGQKWVRDNAKGITFVFKRSVDDEETFERFVGIQIDGKDIDISMYEALAGSVEITLDSALLPTLANGSHTLTAIFADAGAGEDDESIVISSADTRFIVADSAVPGPLTGVKGRMTLLALVSMTALAVILAVRRRREA